MKHLHESYQKSWSLSQSSKGKYRRKITEKKKLTAGQQKLFYFRTLLYHKYQQTHFHFLLILLKLLTREDCRLAIFSHKLWIQVSQDHVWTEQDSYFNTSHYTSFDFKRKIVPDECEKPLKSFDLDYVNNTRCMHQCYFYSLRCIIIITAMERTKWERIRKHLKKSRKRTFRAWWKQFLFIFYIVYFLLNNWRWETSDVWETSAKIP